MNGTTEIIRKPLVQTPHKCAEQYALRAIEKLGMPKTPTIQN